VGGDGTFVSFPFAMREVHMKSVSFKKRVLDEIVKHANDYLSVFVGYDYLIYSDKFRAQPFYILSAKEGNYKHLTGVISDISPYEFFSRCISGTLNEDDFGFTLTKPDGTVADMKGIVKKKIKALSYMSNFFYAKPVAEENFIRGNVSCTLASSDNKITIGFENRMASRPKTLLLGNEIRTPIDITLILSRKRGGKKFDTIIQGDIASFHATFPGLVCLSSNQININDDNSREGDRQPDN